MSRIGKEPVKLAEGVSATVEGQKVTVKGKLGELSYTMHEGITAKVENGNILVTCDDDYTHGNFPGLARALIHNMVDGVTHGFEKKLEINGVGYRAVKEGKDLVLNIGFSHQVRMTEIDGITIEVPAPNKIIISGPDKQKVGQFAANVREKRPPEPYKGKGIKYADETIRRKVGKTGAKK